jgi:hypothetical protein
MKKPKIPPFSGFYWHFIGTGFPGSNQPNGGQKPPKKIVSKSGQIFSRSGPVACPIKLEKMKT